MTEENKELNLVQKIAEVQSGLPPVITKEGHNKAQNYDYVTEAQIKKLVSQPLAKLGVIINPKFVTTNEWTETTKNGRVMHYATVLGTFEIKDGNTTIIGTMPGTGMDTGDKAGYKAETGAQKNYLMQLFMISTGDDPEMDEPQQIGNSYHNQNNNNSRNGNNNWNKNNNYSSSGNRNNSNNQRPQQSSNLNNQPVSQKKFDQILAMIDNVARFWNMKSDAVYAQVKGKYKFGTLNDLSNGTADEILIYLNNAMKNPQIQTNGSGGN